MENASKALIIAGAILLAILIIGLGVYIYNQASNTVSDTGMDQVAIRQFNGQFEPYINKSIDSTAAKALIDTVNQSNKLGKSRIELPDIANKSEIKIGHKYTTQARYLEGVISAIEIIDVNGSSGDDNGIMPSLEDIGPESFNQQFFGLVDVTMPTSEEIGVESRNESQIRELMDRVDRSNKTYENHQILLIIPDGLFDMDRSFETFVYWDDNNYICRITVSRYEEKK